MPVIKSGLRGLLSPSFTSPRNHVGMFRAFSKVRTQPTAFRSGLQSTQHIVMAPRNARQSSSSGLPASYKEDLSKGPMLRYEESLPKLPVPNLEDTAARYLKSVHPLLSSSEYASTSEAVKEFIKPGGVGADLQKKLIARRDEPGRKSWIYEWWNDVAYLTDPSPLQYASYFYSHRDDRKRRDPVKRAAATTSAALEFKKQVDEATLEPEYMKKLPQSMESYQWMFNASRVPARPADYPIKYNAAENKHILVMRKNQLWKVLHEVDGKQLSTAELEEQFKTIYAKATERAIPIGALTSESRDVWTKAKDILLKAHPSNAKPLAEIEGASFVVCLDDAAPVTLKERARQYWHGDGENRWYDKPCQFIINDNGTSGFMGEHSMMDGTATHRLNDFVQDVVFNNKLDFSNPSVRSNLADPVEIKFHITKEVQDEIDRARKDFVAMIGLHELEVQAYQGYGKGLIKKMKCSPDAYVQMAIQLAYYKFYGKNRPTYESVMTRRFQQGRTEVCRTVSDDSVAFCKAISDHTSDPKETAALFHEALKAHTAYTVAAADGRGCDRHLFGLKSLLGPNQEIPAIFKDPVYKYSGTWRISTSQLSSEYFNGFGWAQVTDDGWGIAYMINENNIQFNVVSKGLGSERMSFYLNEALGDIRDLLQSTAEPPKAKL